LPYLLLVLLSALWGSSFLLISVAARGFDPASFAFLRVTIGAAALWGIAATQAPRWPRGGALWLRLAAMSAFGQAIPFWLLGAAARQATSGDLALMMGAAPLFTFLLSRVLGEGERWSFARALGLGLGLAGVALAVSGPAGGVSTLTGRLEGLGAAFLYSVGATLSRDASREVGPSVAAAASMTMSCAALAAFWLVEGGSLAAVPAVSWAAMAALGVFNTALAYWVYFTLVVRKGATFATLNNYVVPFVGLLLGAAFLGEPIRPTAWAGLALVIAGIALTGGNLRVLRRSVRGG
jgi:drug/metabolite transporter (DMT)-like permease